jgi:hypothetical protein
VPLAESYRSAPHSSPMPTDLPSDLRGRYQLPDAKMTLREGLAEYYRVNPGLSDPKEIKDSTSATYFHNHDTTHVVFGTHTGQLHEGVNDVLTLFGVDISFRDYAGGFFATDESKTIAKSFTFKDTFIPVVRTFRLLPGLRRIARGMNKKWPWSAPESYLDRPLDDLRAEYGIHVIDPLVVLGRTD